MIHLKVTKFLISPDGDIEIDEVDPLNKQDISTTEWLYESGFLFFLSKEYLNYDFNFFSRTHFN